MSPASQAAPGQGRVIGIDLGSKRVGVAVCDGHQRLATGVSFVERSGDRRRDHEAVAAVVAEYEAVAVVVGLPLSLSGQVGPAAQAALEEAEELRRELAVPVETVDERLSTVAAASSLAASGLSSRGRRRVVDQTAAAVVLQSWLDRRSGSAGA